MNLVYFFIILQSRKYGKPLLVLKKRGCYGKTALNWGIHAKLQELCSSVWRLCYEVRGFSPLDLTWQGSGITEKCGLEEW
jgi:hypothetical protein